MPAQQACQESKPGSVILWLGSTKHWVQEGHVPLWAIAMNMILLSAVKLHNFLFFNPAGVWRCIKTDSEDRKISLKKSTAWTPGHVDHRSQPHHRSGDGHRYPDRHRGSGSPDPGLLVLPAAAEAQPVWGWGKHCGRGRNQRALSAGAVLC